MRGRPEIYLVHLLFDTSLLVGGWWIAVIDICRRDLFVNSLMGYAAWIPALFLLLLGKSFYIVVYNARLGAWMGTLWRYDE